MMTCANSLPISTTQLDRLTEHLLKWFDRHQRPLPWRQSRDPYVILVSEIMLQQTQVQTVLPYFQKFMERFPNLEALAATNEQEVLKVWEGLGYYSRARNLKKTAEVVCASLDGALPGSAQALGRLPGIGPYTSAAIASQAFGEVVACVDGNIVRVVTRLCAWNDPVDTPKTKARIASFCHGFLDPARPGDTNQALMELGALVCTPKKPDCPRCPLNSQCRTRRDGTPPEARPVKSPRKPPKIRAYESLFTYVDDRFLVAQRPEGGLMSGLWELPTQPSDAAKPWRDWLGLDLERQSSLERAIAHRFTHIQASYRVSIAQAKAMQQPQDVAPYVAFAWIAPSGIAKIPMTRVLRKTLDALGWTIPPQPKTQDGSPRTDASKETRQP